LIPAGCRQEGHPATKTLHQFPFIQRGSLKHVQSTYICLAASPPSAYHFIVQLFAGHMPFLPPVNNVTVVKISVK